MPKPFNVLIKIHISGGKRKRISEEIIAVGANGHGKRKIMNKIDGNEVLMLGKEFEIRIAPLGMEEKLGGGE